MKKLMMVVSLFAVTGCVPMAVGGAAVGGTVAGDNRTVETVLADDPNMAHQANLALNADNTLKEQASVCAVAYNHNLLLVGQAPTEELKNRATDDVRNVKNIRRLFNQIEVKAPIGFVAKSKDAMITSNIKARMLGTTDLKSAQFKVVTEDGTVFLMGLTTRGQAEKATEVARHSSGVKKVVRLVEYLD